MEHKVNEIITYNNEGETIHLKVTPMKNSTCQGCLFQGKCNPYWPYIKDILDAYNKLQRSDNTPIIFKQIK